MIAARNFSLLAALAIALLGQMLIGNTAHGGFTYLGGSTATKWEPGPNTAVKHGFTAPDGPGTPGGATFSIMAEGGLRDVSSLSFEEREHGPDATTSDIMDLDVPTFSSVDDYSDVIDWALDTWAAASGFTNLGPVPDGPVPDGGANVDVGAPESAGGHLGDIRVAAFEITRSSATFAHGFQPGTEAVFTTGGTISGDIHFDVNKTWVDDPNDVSGGAVDIYTVALHEVGHTLGLGHSGPNDTNSVMFGSIGGARRELAAVDIAGIQALYGVPEPSTLLLLVVGVWSLGLKQPRCRRRRC